MGSVAGVKEAEELWCSLCGLVDVDPVVILSSTSVISKYYDRIVKTAGKIAVTHALKRQPGELQVCGSLVCVAFVPFSVRELNMLIELETHPLQMIRPVVWRSPGIGKIPEVDFPDIFALRL